MVPSVVAICNTHAHTQIPYKLITTHNYRLTIIKTMFLKPFKITVEQYENVQQITDNEDCTCS